MQNKLEPRQRDKNTKIEVEKQSYFELQNQVFINSAKTNASLLKPKIENRIDSKELLSNL